MSTQPFIAIDHVQLAIPEGGEDNARDFYGRILQMEEIPKPKELRARGGVWFQSGPVLVHLGVERDFRPARKAHPAFRCERFEKLIQRLQEKDCEIVFDDLKIDGARRAYTFDAFGNRIELIAAD